MPNPNPVQTPKFKTHHFPRLGDADGPLAKKVFGIKLPQDVMDLIEALPKAERVAWARRVLSEAARSELTEPKEKVAPVPAKEPLKRSRKK